MLLAPLWVVTLLEKSLRKGNADSEIVIGAAAITLHGRSRQQRYTKNADWSYISECAALIKDYNQKGDHLSDTVREADERSQPRSKVYFLGNGDCYSHVDYNTHLQEAKVDSVMIARGALIKPVRMISKKPFSTMDHFSVVIHVLKAKGCEYSFELFHCASLCLEEAMLILKIFEVDIRGDSTRPVHRQIGQ